MPRMTDADLEQHKSPKGNFAYSAAKIGDLGAADFTICTIVNDVSSSVLDFKPLMEDCLKKIIEKLADPRNPRRDNLLVRFLQFANGVSEFHGFKTLDQCNIDDYTDCLKVGGNTALYDASRNAIIATSDYAEKLSKQRFKCNGILFVITDGGDNISASKASDVKAALSQAMKNESLESIMTILIGVGVKEQFIADSLDAFAKEVGFTQYIPLKDATADVITTIALFVSQSISGQSKALGSGGPSQPLKF